MTITIKKYNRHNVHGIFMVVIKGLGGCNEVGRMAIQVEDSNERFLLDYGLNAQELEIPLTNDFPLTGAVLSHAHLDHCGMLPDLYRRGYHGPVYSTAVTHELSMMLLRDSLNVQRKRGTPPLYFEEHVRQYERLSRRVDLHHPVRTAHSTLQFFNAGHVPGGVSTLLEMSGKRILYTGDIKFSDTALMKGAHIHFKHLDALIIEATYTTKNHPDRREVASRLRDHVKGIVQRGGTVLLPCFAIGRTQEILLLLSDLGVPIFMDGMGIAATRAILHHPASFACPEKLKKAFSQAHKVTKSSQRAHILKTQGAVICTAGMMQGGPIDYYISHLHANPLCSLMITGFQAPGTPGHTLMETGRYPVNKIDIKPKFQTLSLDFSAHCGRDNLLKFIDSVSPKKTILVHGDRNPEFAQELRGRGHPTFAPENGDRIEV